MASYVYSPNRIEGTSINTEQQQRICSSCHRCSCYSPLFTCVYVHHDKWLNGFYLLGISMVVNRISSARAFYIGAHKKWSKPYGQRRNSIRNCCYPPIIPFSAFISPICLYLFFFELSTINGEKNVKNRRWMNADKGSARTKWNEEKKENRRQNVRQWPVSAIEWFYYSFRVINLLRNVDWRRNW